MKSILDRLDKAFENRMRLALMSALVVQESIDFTSLKEMLDTTDGNLASHIKFLEKRQYIEYEKYFIDKKPKTIYKATSLGRKAFANHLAALEEILKR